MDIETARALVKGQKLRSNSRLHEATLTMDGHYLKGHKTMNDHVPFVYLPVEFDDGTETDWHSLHVHPVIGEEREELTLSRVPTFNLFFCTEDSPALRLCDVLYSSEQWTIVRTIDTATPEELVFETGEVKFFKSRNSDNLL